MTMLDSGTFTLTFDGQTTSAIAWDASASTVQSALESLSNIDAGEVAIVKTKDMVQTVQSCRSDPPLEGEPARRRIG
jgi:hypothetical protein